MMSDSIAIVRDNYVEVRFINERNMRESVTIDKRTYDNIKTIMSEGYVLEDMVLRPNAITRYLKGTSAAAIHTYNNIEKDKMRRQLNEGVIKMMPYAIFVFMVLVGVGVLIKLIGGDADVGSVASSAGTLMPGLK
jgi:hypothetical protein